MKGGRKSQNVFLILLDSHIIIFLDSVYTAMRCVSNGSKQRYGDGKFLALCKFEIPALNDVAMPQLSIFHSGCTTDVNASNLKRNLNDWRVHDNDIIMLIANKPTTSFRRSQYPNDLIASLVKSIRVPQDNVCRDNNDLKNNDFAQMINRNNSIHTHPTNNDLLMDMFKSKYIAERENAFARERAMLDPTNAEGQRLIAEQIQRENIDFSHQFAMEHMPEAYIPVSMLFIKMKINGVEVKAFVDSGAQVSILSDSIAQRCNLMRLVDKRFQARVHGVGGAQQLLGKIHACQVQIEEQFFSCNFDVLANRDIDVLLGLDILKRHRCVIDLQKIVCGYKNTYRFGESAVTHFLPDSEVPQRNLERLGISGPTSANVEVDNAKLASLMALGFEEAAARTMLIQCGNDVEAAAANLFARQL
ncbi:Protein DDI1-like protein 2 [Dirofilaria immitis]|nr:Protein DDI1-like protein 2 [Dirofilaria immitis]